MDYSKNYYAKRQRRYREGEFPTTQKLQERDYLALVEYAEENKLTMMSVMVSLFQFGKEKVLR